ncbi:MAG: histidinol-phosphate aminotransferase [Acidobacteriota bacterium]|jgi:histidinol-phosphate aminotransferase|nr:histidinol-phosphate aminotransferase [Acidobacteriota bacterium]
MSTLSRRAFAQLVGAGAAAAALPMPSLLAAVPRDPVVRLSANENPYGPSPAALAAIRDALPLAWRYPDEAAEQLAETIAQLHGVPANHILLGDGSSEILKLAALAFTGRDRKLAVAVPAFEAIGLYARASGVDVISVPLDRHFAHDLSALAATNASLIYICNPNNPTGSITPSTAIRSFLEKLPPASIALVDEAYHHYADSSDYESVAPLVKSRPNLIVARTFSKIYGMAGLRCGYAIAQPELIRSMEAQAQWDSLNILALAAARASLGDKQHVADGKRRNRETRDALVASMKHMGHDVIPSQTNFVMIDTGRDVKPLIGALRGRGVQVGRLFPALPHHLRVTIGKPQQMAQFVDAFRAVTA